MACYVGMTKDPDRRKREHEAAYEGFSNWRILASGLTYQEALAKEDNAAKTYGCYAEPGGPVSAGRVYSVYKFNYTRKR